MTEDEAAELDVELIYELMTTYPEAVTPSTSVELAQLAARSHLRTMPMSPLERAAVDLGMVMVDLVDWWTR